MKPLWLHPGAREDIATIMAYYEAESGPRLADDFYEEARAALVRVARTPTRFAPDSEGFRRANLRRFPYHALFRYDGEQVRVFVLRHHRRHPNFGLRRAE